MASRDAPIEVIEVPDVNPDAFPDSGSQNLAEAQTYCDTIDEIMITFSDFLVDNSVRYRVPKFPHSSATFNIISGSRILTSPEVLQGALGDSTCPTQCSQPCPMPANRHLSGLTWFPIVLYYIK